RRIVQGDDRLLRAATMFLPWSTHLLQEGTLKTSLSRVAPPATRWTTMADIAPEARLIDVHGLETINVLGPTIQFITPATDDRAPCVMRGTVPPGIVIPLHSHADPETFIAVSGALEGLVFSGDDFRWVSIGPGNVLHVPGHAKHAFRNTGAEP